mmetsp:Transcript_130408/g.260164  ORF Transcript_130408/g.260164 Transcript_130408/m.260164 type:complete len:183 (-) Transcript_130408:47-595(-)
MSNVTEVPPSTGSETTEDGGDPIMKNIFGIVGLSLVGVCLICCVIGICACWCICYRGVPEEYHGPIQSAITSRVEQLERSGAIPPMGFSSQSETSAAAQPPPSRSDSARAAGVRPRSDSTATGSQEDSAGDSGWRCTSCLEQNGPNRGTCRSCGRRKPNQVPGRPLQADTTSVLGREYQPNW